MKLSIHALCAGCLFFLLNSAFAQQPSFTANTTVPAYNNGFYYGTNPGYYGGYNNNATNDKLMHDLFIKAGMHTSRPALYDWFLDQYGPNVRKSEFAYYTATLGMKELTVFLNGPSAAHQSTKMITCANSSGGTDQFRSTVFKNMYTPIWDDSLTGKTPINDTNFYAAYVYKVVKNYGQYIRFYEVWNEPDFAANGNVSLNPGQAGNWWDTNPSPCDLVNLRDDITNYIRMLRITYEVVKSVDPNAYIATGGLGYTNFLDAVMRNTDNPAGGAVTTAYPLKGGAYFDVLSYHCYPEYNLRLWDNSIGGFRYYRHSDYAVQKVIDLRDSFQTILTKYVYNGTSYPSKYFILTEVNIPRQHYGTTDLIGSPEAQRNFLMKTFVVAQKQGIKQVYTYTLGDSKDAADATASQDGFDAMGFFYNLNTATPATAELTPSGVGCKTLSDFLLTYAYDAQQTAALNLPATIDGAAFKKGTDIRYVLWAKTTTDQSEAASKTYTFPAGLNIQSLTTTQWDHSTTGISQSITGAEITLPASPVMVAANLTATELYGVASADSWISVYPNPANESISISVAEIISDEVTVAVYDIQGKVLLTKKITADDSKIAVNNLAAGVYQIEVVSEEKGRCVKKVVVY